MRYRTEIDGLRALAVVPVILFHAGFSLFSGGFIGVDIFFVISGYLITLIIINDLEKNRFSIIDFYERRARRILPALFFVMLCCIPFAFFWMSPDSLKDFAESLIAVCFFGSNILFWSESGYFSAAAEAKPLLHTWSLAVEEQYYLFFPIFLFLAWKLGKKSVFFLILVAAFVSYLLSDWGSQAVISANFYLAPFRAWELLVGSMAAFIINKHGVEKNNTLAILGLITIIVSLFIYDERTPFPGVFALLPITGVVLLILYAEKETLAAKILSFRPFVGIGLISYSAYLWHQPLFAFSRIKLAAEPSLLLMSVLSVASFLLAIFSWKFIEQPFRKKRGGGFTRKNIFTFSAAGLSFFMLIGLVGYFSNGLDYRLTENERHILSFENYDYSKDYRENECFLNEFQTHRAYSSSCIQNGASILWGDSYSASLASGWREIEKNVSQLTKSNCPPLIGAVISSRPHCKTNNDYILREISKHKDKHIYLHASWREYTTEQLMMLKNTIRGLRQVGINKITVIGGVPWYEPSLPRVLVRQRADLSMPVRSNADLRTVLAADEIIEKVASQERVAFVKTVDKLCSHESCDSVIETAQGFEPMVWDNGHVTKHGAIYLYNKLFGK